MWRDLPKSTLPLNGGAWIPTPIFQCFFAMVFPFCMLLLLKSTCFDCIVEDLRRFLVLFCYAKNQLKNNHKRKESSIWPN